MWYWLFDLDRTFLLWRVSIVPYSKPQVSTILQKEIFLAQRFSSGDLPPFSLIRDFGKQNTRETFPKFPSVLRVIDRSDRNPPITATSVTFRPSLRLLVGCDWWISIRSVNNMYDWWKFWKHFCWCFVFQSRVSTKTVVGLHFQELTVSQGTSSFKVAATFLWST